VSLFINYRKDIAFMEYSASFSIMESASKEFEIIQSKATTLNAIVDSIKDRSKTTFETAKETVKEMNSILILIQDKIRSTSLHLRLKYLVVVFKKHDPCGQRDRKRKRECQILLDRISDLHNNAPPRVPLVNSFHGGEGSILFVSDDTAIHVASSSLVTTKFIQSCTTTTTTERD